MSPTSPLSLSLFHSLSNRGTIIFARLRRRLHYKNNERRTRGRDGHEHRTGGRDGGQPAQHGHRHGQRDHLAEPEARID